MPSRGPLDKVRGAYYTEISIAHALCRWALRGSGGELLDPAFGGGVFLEAAAAELARIGSGCSHGVEIDREVFERVSAALPDPHRGRLLNTDFFSLGRNDVGPVDAVVGNPPFIRFQRFGGAARSRALQRSLEAGVELSPLAGSWVAFVAHSLTFLRRGGRLAMVLPAELGHAPYARSLLAALHDSFASVTFVTFRNSLFPHLDQDTILLLADGYGHGPGRFAALELQGSADLSEPLPCSGPITLDTLSLVEGSSSLPLELLDGGVSSLYRGLAAGGAVRFSEIARIESGYVTGANSFFHRTRRQALEADLPGEALVPSLFRSSAARGLSFGLSDWERAAADGDSGYLVQAEGFEANAAIGEFLSSGEASGVPHRYKTRNRRPWYRVPRVRCSPLLLSAMSARAPRLVVNEAGVAVPNTFHYVTPMPADASPAHASPAGPSSAAPSSAAPSSTGPSSAAGWPAAPLPYQPRSLRVLAASWLTSLTELSLELEGHALGGGLLKLDPGEAGQVLVAPGDEVPDRCLDRLDHLLRCSDPIEARNLADRLFLFEGLGLSLNDIDRLRGGVDSARIRRLRRGGGRGEKR